MKKITILFVVLSCNSLIRGQAVIESATKTGETAPEPYKTQVYATGTSKNLPVQGHRYFEEGNKLATIYTNGKKAVKCLVRYNSFSDEIEVTEIYKILKKDYVKVVLDREGYSYKLLEHEGQKRFFILFNRGKTSLALKTYKRIRRGKDGTSGYEESTPDKYVGINKYFIRNEIGDLIPVKFRKKEILKVLEKEKKPIEKYASANKLNFKKEKDVIKIINYYNSL